MFADQVRAAIEAAPRDRLPLVAQAMWQAVVAGSLTDGEAEDLDRLIQARQALQAAPTPPRRAVGSRPRTDASMERRRRWASSGRMPPQVACRFTLAEQAVLAVVAVETVKRGDCRLFHGAIAALAGVAVSTVRATLRRARDMGFITSEERRSSAWRNLSSVVRIVSPEWSAWNRLARGRAGQGGADISSTGTNTGSHSRSRERPSQGIKGVSERGDGRSVRAPLQHRGYGPQRAQGGH